MTTSSPAGRLIFTPAFGGYPYLVTRIGHSALRHVAVVPADWSRERLVDLTRQQAEANQLETCLCLGPSDAAYVSPGTEPQVAGFVPSGLPVVDGLIIAGPLPDTDELATRREALRAWVEQLKASGHMSGYIVGDNLEAGRPATAEEIALLSGRIVRGLPQGLSRCLVCWAARGEYLDVRGSGRAGRAPGVIHIYCHCDNHNRCAGCGEPLASQRLSAWAWKDDAWSPGYMAAYGALRHRCGEPLPARQVPRNPAAHFLFNDRRAAHRVRKAARGRRGLAACACWSTLCTDPFANGLGEHWLADHPERLRYLYRARRRYLRFRDGWSCPVHLTYILKTSRLGHTSRVCPDCEEFQHLWPPVPGAR